MLDPQMQAAGRYFGDGWDRTGSGLFVPAPRPELPRTRPVGVDLFCGAGGFSTGFKMAGIHVAAAVEAWGDAAATYLVNLGSPDTIVHTDEHPQGRPCSEVFTTRTSDRLPKGACPAGTGWIAGDCSRDDYSGGHPLDEECKCARCVDALPCEHFWQRDVRDITGEEICEALGVAVGEVTVVFGGPPCQGYSMAGKRDVMDPRNSLVFEFCRLVLEIRPKTMAMENVTGMLNMVTPEGVPVVDAMARILADGDFGDYNALKRSLTGLPDTRAALRRETGHPAAKLDTEAAAEELALFSAAGGV